MQTDPIFYTDDMDIYSYAGNDPMDGGGPTGTTCTVNDKGTGDCKVDDPGKMTKREIKTTNAAYTNAVNKLLAKAKAGDKAQKITVNGKSFSVRPSGLAKSLIGAKVIGGGVSNRALASTAGGTLDGKKTESGEPEITIYRNAVSNTAMQSNTDDRSLSQTFIHEGIHTQSEGKALQDQYDADRDQFQIDHHDPYNSAAFTLFN